MLLTMMCLMSAAACTPRFHLVVHEVGGQVTWETSCDEPTLQIGTGTADVSCNDGGQASVRVEGESPRTGTFNWGDGVTPVASGLEPGGTVEVDLTWDDRRMDGSVVWTTDAGIATYDIRARTAR